MRMQMRLWWRLIIRVQRLLVFNKIRSTQRNELKIRCFQPFLIRTSSKDEELFATFDAFCQLSPKSVDNLVDELENYGKTAAKMD